MTEPSRAIFLSYASQDAEAARRICEALQGAGIEVWLDTSELRSGDSWDQKIRQQIRDCALFVPVISVNTASRLEGYFRLEWKLAVDRSHLMAAEKPFLLPVVVDATQDGNARVPDKFREVQWTRLPAGATPAAFVERIAKLLSPDEPVGIKPTHAPSAPAAAPSRPAASEVRTRKFRAVPLLIGLVLAMIAVGYFAVDKFVLSKRVATPITQGGLLATSAIPEESVAVLPFVDLSEKKDQEYFSDGLSEELIDLLTQVPDLRVPARTSSFYFKGKNETIANIAQQLKVAHVLEGSVRKAGKRLRITAQLIRVDNGYHLWSQTYDRDDTDVFAVQDDIAKAVVSALQVKLAEGAQATSSRGTMNTEAYNQYLLGRQLTRRNSLEGDRHAIEAYGKAIALDPNYAAAYAGLAIEEGALADDTGDAGGIERARHDVEKAILLAPNDAIGYATRSYIRSTWLWDWSGAQTDIEKALTLDPRNSDVQHRYASLLDLLGRRPEAIAAQKKATELDPLSSIAWENLGRYYTELGDYGAADAALVRAIELEPTSVYALNNLGRLRLLQGKGQEALETFRKMDFVAFRLTGVAMAEHTLGHARESQQAQDELIAKEARDAAYQIAEIFAWRGERDRAFEWLARAYSQKDGGLSLIKGDPLLKSLRSDPRFNALLRKLKLPD
jgi:TolB-like protein/Flp pilus assembly protein TadD